MSKEPIYTVTYCISGQPERPMLKRGTRMELPGLISDALSYQLDHLEITKERTETTTEEILELLEPVKLTGEFLEVKQAPINTANHKCRFCGKSIREEYRRDFDGGPYWVHQHSNLTGCWLYDGTNNHAYPVGG